MQEWLKEVRLGAGCPTVLSTSDPLGSTIFVTQTSLYWQELVLALTESSLKGREEGNRNPGDSPSALGFGDERDWWESLEVESPSLRNEIRVATENISESKGGCLGP